MELHKTGVVLPGPDSIIGLCRSVAMSWMRLVNEGVADVSEAPSESLYSMSEHDLDMCSEDWLSKSEKCLLFRV